MYLEEKFNKHNEKYTYLESTKIWTWIDDQSVKPFTDQQLEDLQKTDTVNNDENKGWSFEVVSPGPPNVLTDTNGLQSVVEVLTTLREMGVQAPPSAGLHVHINVGAAAAPGQSMTIKNLANIWAAYAMYHLVIDEFLTPMRINNYYAASLFLGNRKMNDGVPQPRKIFEHILGYLETMKTTTEAKDFGTLCEKTDANPIIHKECYNFDEFCNQAIGGPKHNDPCFNNPNIRYYTLNLMSLTTLGTLEFRSHSATYDTAQVLHWIIFHVAFVEAFKGKAIADNTLEGLEKKQKIKKLTDLQKEMESFTKSEKLKLDVQNKLFRKINFREKILASIDYEATVKYLGGCEWSKGIGCKAWT